MKKKALGRGLAELIPGLDEEIPINTESAPKFEKKDLEIKFLPVENVLFSSFQPRLSYEEDGKFKELLKSIESKGVLQPILVRQVGENLYECVAGERRLRACKHLGIEKIPAIVRDLSDKEVLLIALIENVQRKDLNPIEEALSYRRLIEEFGYTQEEIAQEVGKDRATIANLIRLLSLPEEIQRDVIEGRLSVGHAKVILSLKTREEQFFLRDEIIKKGLSVREAEKLAERLKAPKRQKKEPDPDLLELSQELSQLVGSRVKISQSGKKTKILFEFNSPEKVEEFIFLLRKLCLS